MRLTDQIKNKKERAVVLLRIKQTQDLPGNVFASTDPSTLQ